MYPFYQRIQKQSSVFSWFSLLNKNVEINDLGARIPMQDILNHATNRLWSLLTIPEDGARNISNVKFFINGDAMEAVLTLNFSKSSP